MLNNFSSKCIKMTKRCAFGTSYSITYFNSGIKVRPSLGKACTNLCHVFGFVISTPGQGQQLLTGLFKKMVRRSTSSKGVNKQKHCSTPSNMAVIIYGYIGCEDKATTWYLNGFPDGSNLGSTV